MKKYGSYFVFFIVHVFITHAQDLHFSQFNENPSIINPALTGATNPFRASVSYRDQWRSVTTPYKTFGVSFETRFRTSKWQQVDKFRSMTFKQRSIGRLAWGLSVYNDNAGTGSLVSTRANLSLASFVPVSRESFISIGLQGGIVQCSVKNSNFIFPSQYDGHGYNSSLPQHENFSSLNYNYFNFAGGALWSYGQASNRIAANSEVKGNIGFSFYHISTPHNGFFADKEVLQMKYVLHGDLLYGWAGSNLAVVPSFLLQMRGSSTELMFGSLVKYYIKFNSKYTGNVKRSSIGYGAYLRNRDALVIALALEKDEQFVIGLSYDVNFSTLAGTSTGRGGFEITLRYTPPNAFLYQKKASSVDK